MEIHLEKSLCYIKTAAVDITYERVGGNSWTRVVNDMEKCSIRSRSIVAVTTSSVDVSVELFCQDIANNAEGVSIPKKP